MTLSVCLFLTLNTLCLLALCLVLLTLPPQDHNKHQTTATFLLTLWASTSIFITAAAWAAYWS